MAMNFFCTVPRNAEQENDDNNLEPTSSLVSTLTDAPTFVKSTAKSLFQEEEDIR